MEFILDTLGKVGFEWRMALFNFVNFLIIFALLKYFFFKPILKTIRERQEKAKEGVENYKKAQTELQMAERKAQEMIDDAKAEGNKVIEKAHDEAQETTERMKMKARNEIEMLVNQAKKNIDVEKQEMREELKHETSELVIAIAEKVLKKKVDQKADDAIIGNSVSSMK